MSNKPVSGLDLPKHLCEKLNQTSIFTVKVNRILFLNVTDK